MTQNPIRHYVVLKTVNRGITEAYFGPSMVNANNWATNYVAEHVYGFVPPEIPFRCVARPSNDVYWGTVRPTKPPDLPEVVVALSVTGNSRRTSREVVNDIIKA